MFCSTLWKPYLLKDIRQLEQLQRHTTKYILKDYTSNYKSRLLELKILPLMYVLDICDIKLKNLKPLQMHLISLHMNSHFEYNNIVVYTVGCLQVRFKGHGWQVP